MKVIHLPIESGEQVSQICKQLQQNGLSAVGLSWRNNYIGYDPVILQSDAYEMANTIELAIRYFDIFHYHGGYTVFKDKSDILSALDQGKKIIMHHRGNDIRIPSLAKQGKHHFNPYVYTGDSQPEAQILKNLRFFSRHVSTAIVQDYELYDYVADYYRNVHILPRLIDTKQISPVFPSVNNKRPLVLHAPTSRRFKGTDEILKIVKSLQKEWNFQFQLVEFTSRTETLRRLRKADIIIDQILAGSYGNLSVEGMTFGKPVICYLRPDILRRMPAEIPIVSANPDNLYDQLKLLISNPELRFEKGVAGRRYAETYHASDVVIKQLIQIYNLL